MKKLFIMISLTMSLSYAQQTQNIPYTEPLQVSVNYYGRCGLISPVKENEITNITAFSPDNDIVSERVDFRSEGKYAVYLDQNHLEEYLSTNDFIQILVKIKIKGYSEPVIKKYKVIKPKSLE